MTEVSSRELWTTRDLQEAAAAGELVEDFAESEEDDDEEDVDDVDVDEVDEAAGAFEVDERLSVR
jgi:hypothetical protein